MIDYTNIFSINSKEGIVLYSIVIFAFFFCSAVFLPILSLLLLIIIFSVVVCMYDVLMNECFIKPVSSSVHM